ncbi:Uncharacterised protein [Klebsiella pneumoniae]|nr:Uncharacterised protein [Klebsiella pneumoniae]
MNLQQVTELLPPVVIQIADLIGFPATERLLSAFGGTTFPIGKGLRAFGGQRAALLRDTIGDHNTKLLFKNLLVNLCISLVVSELYASCGMFVSSQNLMKLIRTALLR